LMHFLTLLGSDVDIVVRHHSAKTRRAGRVRVIAA
jgi:hypothetical protein